MKIKLETVIVNEVGEEMDISEGKKATLSAIITTALLTPFKQDDNMSGEEKAELFNIWFDKIKDKKEADLKPEEVVKIKKRIGYGFPPIVVGQAYKLLN